MKLLVKEDHDGEGVFPLFPKDSIVSECVDCENTPHWCSCVIHGYRTYIPETYVDGDILTRDYNPTELVAKKDQTITLLEIAFEWLYVQDENNIPGWIPANKVVSI